jgi:hypothetical protein
MPVARWAVTVNRKPDEVVAYLSDFSKHEPPGFAGLNFPIILALVVKPGVQKGMNQLKAKLEQGAA